MTKLSPAAAAVFNAYAYGWNANHFMDIKALAAALRAAVDQVVPETELLMNARGTRSWHRAIRQAEIRAEFLAIADELEAL